MSTPLPSNLIAELRHQYPNLRNDYFDYLSTVGWGESETGRMIYERPTDSAEIYGPRDELAEIVLLGDDLQGYCFGYDAKTNCYGEVADDGSWESWPLSEGIARYVGEPEDNAR